MEASAVEVRLHNHDARLESHHNALGELRATTARHETDIKVIGTELRETREDISEIRKALADARDEQKEENKWMRRGLWAAAGTFLLFFVAVASLLVQMIGGA